MVIGSGLLAKSFFKYVEEDEIIIFASGVSDSKMESEAEYRREFSLLKETIEKYPGKRLVYFSTCGILDSSMSETSYIKHKLFIENFIQQHQSPYLIFRISNLVGNGGNPKTIINYLVNVIKNGIHFDLWKNSFRNILDVDDAYELMQYFIQNGTHSTIINIANPISYSAAFIVQEIEQFLQRKANYTLVERGSRFFIDTHEIEAASNKLGIHFPGDYLFSKLTKYYKK